MISADADKEAADISAQVDADRAARVSVWAALGTPELRAQLHIGIHSCSLSQYALSLLSSHQNLIITTPITLDTTQPSGLS